MKRLVYLVVSLAAVGLLSNVASSQRESVNAASQLPAKLVTLAHGINVDGVHYRTAVVLSAGRARRATTYYYTTHTAHIQSCLNFGTYGDCSKVSVLERVR